MADMHLQARSFGKEALELFIKQFNAFLVENPGRKPDYIAIAGDLVVGKDSSQDKYLITKTVVNRLLEAFGLKKERLIAVPGNHDKEVPTSPWEWGKDYEAFLPIFSKAFINKHEAERFTSLFSHFNSFCDFYSPYINTGSTHEQYQYLYDSLLFNKPEDKSYMTSGLKVFIEDKICFLCINSEWTYYPNEKKEGRHVRIFAPAVQYSLNQITQNYADFLVVTLIHRNPASFTFEEKNLTIEGDILQRIYMYSDVILTGHDHSYNLLPPDMMANSAQLLRLGSISRSDHLDEFVPFNAALLQIEPHTRKMEIINCQFKGMKEGEWRFHHMGSYPLKSLFSSKHIRYTPIKGHIIQVNSLLPEHIESGIRAARRLPDCFRLLIYPATQKNSLQSITYQIDECLCSNIPIYVIIFCVDTAFTPSGTRLMEVLQDTYLDDILNIRIVLEMVFLEYPNTAQY